MRQLECGCELSPSGAIASTCSLHGAHVRAFTEAAKHPRSGGRSDRELEVELTKIVLPLVLSRWSTATDPETVAECVRAHVHQNMARLA